MPNPILETKNRHRHIVKQITPKTLAPVVPCEAKALHIVATLREKGFEAFTVGGCIRDRLLGAMPKDVDITTNAKPDDVTAIFPKTIPVGAAFGVIIVVQEDEQFEVATFRHDEDYKDGRHPTSVSFTDAKTDAERRDFTINALFYDPIAHEIHDFVGGIADLRAGVIRAIGNPKARFAEDHLRMLRAVRFAAHLGFEMDPETAGAIRERAATIASISKERIFAELSKMLMSRHPSSAFEMMRDLGLLEHVLPQVAAMVGVEQPKRYHPEGDVWTHTMLMLDHTVKGDLELRWAVLLHDVGKPPTFQLSGEGIERFPGHAKAGADLTTEILHDLRCPNHFIDRVSKAVYYHMGIADARRMKKSTLRRLLNRDTFALELELHRIDCMSCHRKADNFVYLLDKIEEYRNEPVMPEPLITGRDLLAMGFPQSKLIGEILRDVQNRQLEGELNSAEEALAFVAATHIREGSNS